MTKLFKDKLSKHYLALAIILFSIFIFRLPSLFEPYWYGDEGIFAAVASNLNQGGVLYQTAWDNKPPMIYLTYAAIFKTLGVSMFNLRIVTLIVVMATAAAVYEIAIKTMDKKRALWAAFLFGFISSLRLIEGNLSLTEIFMIMPITLAMLIAILRKFDYVSVFLVGLLFAGASLYKQVGAFEAAALGIYLFLISDNFWEFFKKGFVLSVGFAIPYLATVGYFVSKGLLGDYIFGAYTYYRLYFSESPRYATLINISKYLPIVATVVYGLWKKWKRQEIGFLHLFLLWASFSFLGSYFSGRTYGHYLVQAVPSVSLLLASIAIPKKLKVAPITYAIVFIAPIIFLTQLLFSNFLTAGPINQLKYWQNFVVFASGGKTVNSYNSYFDGGANTIEGLNTFFEARHDIGASAYIWGDMSWLYAVSNLKNPSRYVTSFHVFGVPGGQIEVAKQLNAKVPKYIIKGEKSIGTFYELEKLLFKRYTFVSTIENAQVYILSK